MNNDDNFWSIYEKNLGIVKEEPKEKTNSKPGSFQKRASSKSKEEEKSSLAYIDGAESQKS